MSGNLSNTLRVGKDHNSGLLLNKVYWETSLVELHVIGLPVGVVAGILIRKSFVLLVQSTPVRYKLINQVNCPYSVTRDGH